MAVHTVVVGAGPYGLSVSAMLSAHNIEHRIFGTPMRTWSSAMPKGMSLKSEGFASNLYGGDDALTLADHCARNGLPYRDAGLPVPLDVFVAYGRAFQRQHVPQLEPREVADIRRAAGGYAVSLVDGGACFARNVVIAAGITHFAHVPAALAGLPEELCRHASTCPEPSIFEGRRIAVIGAGASATDYAALAAEAGARVTLIVRNRQIHFLGKPDGRPRSLLNQLKAPQSGLGPGWRSRMATDAPLLFHIMPAGFRQFVARRHLGPAGGWWTRDAIDTLVEVKYGTTVVAARHAEGGIVLDLCDEAGVTKPARFDQIVPATGYHPALNRLPFLAPDLRALPTLGGAPVLSAHFEAASAGLYFTGLAAVNEFGPLLRFAFGANFAGRRVAAHLASKARRHVAGFAARRGLQPVAAVGDTA